MVSKNFNTGGKTGKTPRHIKMVDSRMKKDLKKAKAKARKEKGKGKFKGRMRR